MPSLERAPCDELVFDFPYQKKSFFLCVCLAVGYGVYIHIVYGHRAIPCSGTQGRPWQSRTEAMRRWYGKGAAREGGRTRRGKRQDFGTVD